MDNAYKQAALAEQKRQFDKEYNAKYGSSGGSGGGSAKLTSGSSSSSKKKSSSSSSSSLSNSSSKSSSSSSSAASSIKLSNGKTAYTDAQKAYIAGGGRSPYSAAGVIKKGLVKSYSYKGTTYYYV